MIMYFDDVNVPGTDVKQKQHCFKKDKRKCAINRKFH